MAEPASVPASHRGHVYIQWVLRGGLVLASVLMAIGLVMAIATGEHGRTAVHLARVFSEGSIADRLVAIGLALLALTPVVRVLALVLIWLAERDRRFAVIGAIVLAILAFSIVTGHGG